MIGREDQVFGRYEQPNEGPFADDFDIGFITGGGVIHGAFELQIEAVAVIGGGLGVIEDGLVRDGDIKDALHDIGGFAGRDGEGDVEGEDEAKDVLRVMDSSNVDERFDGPGVCKFCRLE